MPPRFCSRNFYIALHVRKRILDIFVIPLLKDDLYVTISIEPGAIMLRINQDFLIEHSCILHIRSNLLLL